MDLNQRRLAAAEELYQKLDICGPHILYTAESEKAWVETENGFQRAVEFEEEVGGGCYENHSGTFSVIFEKGTSILSAAFSEIAPDVKNHVNGKRLQDFLRAYLPHLSSPFATAIHVKVERKYDADHAELVAQKGGAVTTKALARYMLAPFQAEFGTISGLSFRRNADEGTYEIDIRLPLSGFPDTEVELSKFSQEQLAKAIEVGETFEIRLKSALPEGTLVAFAQATIKTPTHSYAWWDILDAQRTYDIRNGINLKDFNAEEVAAITVLQIGDHAVLEDGAADCFAVARIDEDGLCHPIQGDLSFEDAETILKELSVEAGPVFEAFSA